MKELIGEVKGMTKEIGVTPSLSYFENVGYNRAIYEVIKIIEQYVPKFEDRINSLEKSKDSAYKERDSLVRYLSTQYPSHLMRHPDSDTEWEDDWRWIVCIHSVAGQMTWHIHDSELYGFGHLVRTQFNDWDGHTTEEKYKRLCLLAKKSYYCETDKSS